MGRRRIRQLKDRVATIIHKQTRHTTFTGIKLAETIANQENLIGQRNQPIQNSEPINQKYPIQSSESFSKQTTPSK